jgi:threonine synthase
VIGRQAPLCKRLENLGRRDRFKLIGIWEDRHTPLCDESFRNQDGRNRLSDSNLRTDFIMRVPMPTSSTLEAAAGYVSASFYAEGCQPLAASASLMCIEQNCRARYALTDVLYQCPRCGGLLEVDYDWSLAKTDTWKQLWRARRMDNHPLSQSGVWRYREMLPFLDRPQHVVTLREGNTPILSSAFAAEYAGLENISFKHQGFNPTGSFKDNGMTAGVAQARRLGKTRVACVSTGNTSASMAAYASAAGLTPVVFLPHGNISFGKLAQALEYGAVTLEVEANFDQILALVREVCERADVYLLNSINPFRIEGQKSMAIELLDQLDWSVPDWVVMPGGNLGNASAFGKGFIEAHNLGLIPRLPRVAVVQASGSAPFYEFLKDTQKGLQAVTHPETLATAIRIGDPVSWPKALRVIQESAGVVEVATEEEIADAKAVIGKSGIGCEPASAATLAGIRKLVERGVIGRGENVLAVLTGNLLKDPDYIYRYHTGALKTPQDAPIVGKFANCPRVVANDATAILKILECE